MNYVTDRVHLKVLSCEMDLPESGINRQVFLKGQGAQVFNKISLLPKM
jgi:hypothetical protein